MFKLLKIISVLSFLIFLSGCFSSGAKLVNSNKIKPGMTKIDVEWVLASRALMYQAALPEGYREYFSSSRKEILSDEQNQVYYIYKNVYTPVKCGFLMCDLGDGILEKTFFNYSDARKFIKGEEKIKIMPKTTVTIENNGQSNEVESEDIIKLQVLIKDFESGKITEEEFIAKKSKIIK